MTLISRTLIILIIGVLSWLAFSRIVFNADPLDLLPSGLPQVKALKTYEDEFAAQNDLIIALTNGDIEHTEQSADSLAAFLSQHSQYFKALSSKAPWDEDPSQMGELLAYVWANGAPTELEQLLNDDLTEAGARERLEESYDVLSNSMNMADLTRASFDPLSLSNLDGESFSLEGAMRLQFVSPDGELRILLAEPAEPLDSESEVEAWVKAVQNLVEQWKTEMPELAEGTRIQLTGRGIYVAEMTSSLKRDLGLSAVLTMGFIIIVFWLMYRRILPLAWLLMCLYLTFLITLLIGEQIFARLSAMSIGFAAILMGLAVDYGFVIYQESLCSDEDPKKVHHSAGMSIGWAALTTACVFLALNLSSMPGAAQLGTMVAVGVCVGAVVMIFGYSRGLSTLSLASRSARPLGPPKEHVYRKWPLVLTAGVVVASGVVLGFLKLPSIDYSPDSLRPNDPESSFQVYTDIANRLAGNQRAVTLMVEGKTVEEVEESLKKADEVLRGNPHVAGYTLPLILWPNQVNQEANRPLLAELLEFEDRLIAQAIETGFADESLELTRDVFSTWRRFLETPDAMTLTNPASLWLTQRILDLNEGTKRALGFIRLPEGRMSLEMTVANELADEGVWLIGWEFLNSEIFGLIQHDLVYVVIPTAAVLLIMLIIVFRSVEGVVLCLATLAFSGLVLIAVMRLLGMEWNLVSIAAIPLLLGAGLDYNLHIQLALRRTGGKVGEVRRSIGRALLLCGTTTAVGFASLIGARHGGLPSLGAVCAMGILITMVTAIFLLPNWWQSCHRSVGSKTKSDA